MDNAMISGLDPSSFSSVITPANDIFRYVNGPWIDTYRLPDDRSRFGSFDMLAQNAEEQIRDILEDENCTASRSQALYRSFCDTEAIDQAGMSPIAQALGRIDSAKDKGELIHVLGGLNPSGGPDLMDIGIYGDPDDPDTNIVHIEQSGLGLPDEAYYREDRYAPIREQYRRMLAGLLLLAQYGDAETCEAMADRVIGFETRLASHHWDNVATRDSQKTHNPTDFAALKSTLSHVDIEAWAAAWQQSYDAAPSTEAQPVDVFDALQHTMVHEPSFLSGLDEVWDESRLDDLILWARAHMLIHW
ncbi:MAG: M13 family metallopeptidase, partial [Bifidobacterium mongoliense]|nr:M13 family metallopeptidase [Bifidobacterium mongoliense]